MCVQRLAAVLRLSFRAHRVDTTWRALDAVEELEQRLGETVIAVNQATIWMALRRMGWTKPIDGFGSLLRSLG